VGLYAVAGCVWIAITGGAEPLYGPRSSDMWNNNNLGATLVAIAPFFVFLGRRATPWVRRGADVLYAATIVAVLGTYSRAAALALALMLVMLAAFRQWRALIVPAVAVVVLMLFVDSAAWFDRMYTLRAYDREHSAAMRKDEWYVAWRTGLDHPFLGAGFAPFSAEVYQRYLPTSTDRRDAHNLLLQVFAEHGFPGVLLYVALLASTFASLWQTIRRPPAADDDGWWRDCACMLLVALAAYLLDAMFHVLSYRPFLMQLLVLSMMVNALARGHR
jgi:probable O-glycosylation ligase (exosortase A-associated)